jgi:hypothetical protein
MNDASALLMAGLLALVPVGALADDKTSPATTGADQGKMKQDAALRKGAYTKMTPDEKAALQKPVPTDKQNPGDTIAKSGNPDAHARGLAISKSAADSKASPAPPRGTMNTPEGEKLLKQQKGQ